MIEARRPDRLRLALRLFVVASVFVLPHLAQASPLERCLEQVRAGRHDANVDLCVVCPAVAGDIRRQTVAPLLDKPLRCPLKLAEAADVAAYRLDAARTLPPGGPAPTALAPVLEELALKFDTAPEGWWDRFRRWLRQWFTDDEGSLPPWLEEWLKSLSLPDWFGDVAFKAALLVILILAAIIVFNELRALRWRGRAPRSRGRDVAGVQRTRAIPRTLDEIRALPLSGQPGALLQYVIAQLVRANRLPDRRDQTNHELAISLRRRETALAESFAGLVSDVERAVYGGRRLDEAGATSLWRNAEQVLVAGAVTDKQAGSK